MNEVDYRYHARHLQVEAIKNETLQILDNALSSSEDFQLAAALLWTPLFLHQSYINSAGLSQESVSEKLYSSVKLFSERKHVLMVLENLSTACEPTSRSLREVAIDTVDTTAPPEFLGLFHDKNDLLKKAASEGRENSSRRILSLIEIEDGIPLLKYRKDLARGRVGLISSAEGGYIGYIPTRIDKVKLKLWYPKNENIPQLSLLINPFED
jgi:hypothetical protein